AKIEVFGRRVFIGRLEREPLGAGPMVDVFREEMLVALSHDMRTPLQAILSWSQLLRSTPANAALSTIGLEAIERNIRWQVEVLEDALELSQILSGDLQLDLQPVRVSEVVEQAVGEVFGRAHAQRIRLARTLEAEESTVLADRHWL